MMNLVTFINFANTSSLEIQSLTYVGAISFWNHDTAGGRLKTSFRHTVSLGIRTVIDYC